LSDNARGGNDVLVSGARADDEMWGDGQKLDSCVGTGSDRFVFRPDNGADVINDFESGKDHIDLTDFAVAGIHNFNDLTYTQTPTGTSLDLGLSSDGVSNSVALLELTALHENDFLFA
jgi:hypothetical protein